MVVVLVLVVVVLMVFIIMLICLNMEINLCDMRLGDKRECAGVGRCKLADGTVLVCGMQ